MPTRHDLQSPPHRVEGRGLGRRFTRREVLGRMGGATLGVAALSLSQRYSPVAAQSPPSVMPANAYGAEVPYQWFVLMDDLLRETPGFSPPVASRAIGYAGLALYEALVPGMAGYRSLADQLNGLPALPGPQDHAYYWPLVANSALAGSFRALFPTTSDSNKLAIDDLEAALVGAHMPGVPRGIVNRSIKRGQNVAMHIYEWSKTDGGHEGYLRNFPEDYEPPERLGLWQPTPPGFQRAMQPAWGDNRTFAIGNPASIPVAAPPPFSTEPGSAFHQSALDVYQAVIDLTPEQEIIARFWADDPGATSTPPGHSLSILNQVVMQEDVDLARAAEAYAQLGMAVADAFICCWHTKFEFNLIRPISYIQEHIDPGWGNPLPVTTPPFPEYTSGHSVQSGAAAQVLTDLFGDVNFTDHTHDRLNLEPRGFDSFFDFAEEAAISRLYGGIHYREAIEVGIDQGKSIGNRVNALKFGPE